MKTETTEPSLHSSISQFLRATATTVSSIIQLAILESRLAGLSLLNIAGLFVISCLLISATWLTFLIAMTAWLISLHLHLLPALFIVMFFNVALLIPTGLLIKHYAQRLRFAATRRQLRTSQLHNNRS